MTRTRLALSSLAVLAAASLSACGGSNAPADASEKEFCEATLSVYENFDFSDPKAEPDEAEIAESLRAWGEELEEVGTPESMSEDAREGFEVTLDQLADLEAEDISQDGSDFYEDLSDDEEKQVEAYTTYIGETCGLPGTDDLPELETPSSDG